MARRINSPYWQTNIVLPLTLNQATLEFISQFPIHFKGFFVDPMNDSEAAAEALTLKVNVSVESTD